MMKIAHWSLGILLSMPIGIAAGQAQPAAQDAQAPAPTDSLAAAAKAAREAKKDQTKPAHMWNDDTIPKSNAAISVVGKTPADDADNAAAATSDAANGSAGAGGGAAAGAGNRAALETSIRNAKEKLATIKVDLDLLQRTYTLDSQMYYGKPDFASDTDGAAKLKDEQDQIAAKQQEMDEEQKKIDDMEAELSNLPAADAAPATPQANNNSN
jgi:type I restriction-modification system DNA methylase subunit